MKILVLGGNGGTGRLVAAQARAKGHEVTIASRSGGGEAREASPREGRSLRCDATRPDEVAAAVAGHDAVVIAVGTGDVKASTLRTDTARNVVQAMAAAGVRRLVAVSGLGAGDSMAAQPWPFRKIIGPLLLGKLLADQNGLEDAIRASTLDWTIARPGQLVDRAPRAIVTSLEGKVPAKVSRSALAAFLLGELEAPRFLRQAVAVGE